MIVISILSWFNMGNNVEFPNQRIYFKENDFEDLVQEFIDNNYENYSNLTDEELEKVAEEKVNQYEWKKTILVYIETL